MYDLVDSILEYSRLDSVDQIKKEKTDLTDIINNIQVLIWGTISDKNVQINFNNLPLINYYPSVLKIVLKNLIENGIKYNESDSPTIDITLEKKGDKILLYVKDNGIGIAPKYHEQIFGMFSRLNNRSTYTGSGMGLAFCKKVMLNHDSDIQVRSNIGQGSTFILILDAVVISQETLVA